jgi:hypothetical protein
MYYHSASDSEPLNSTSGELYEPSNQTRPTVMMKNLMKHVKIQIKQIKHLHPGRPIRL